LFLFVSFCVGLWRKKLRVSMTTMDFLDFELTAPDKRKQNNGLTGRAGSRRWTRTCKKSFLPVNPDEKKQVLSGIKLQSLCDVNFQAQKGLRSSASVGG